MLYKRDYSVLTDEEKEKGRVVKEWFANVKQENKIISGANLTKYWSDLPQAVMFHDSLFPNNFLPPEQFENSERFGQTIEEFKQLLDRQCSERDVLNFLKVKEAYFLVSEIFKEFRTGHHDAYAFREFKLSTNYIADYLLVGKSSGGYEFIFVEFESPKSDITIGDGEFGTAIRKGLKQIEDWDNWIDANFSQLKAIFDKYRNPNVQLSNEFIELDKSRVHFALIAGRRNDFKQKTYRLKRKNRRSSIAILHYDNLIDYAQYSLNIAEKRLNT